MVRTKDAYGNDRGTGGDVVSAVLTQVSTDQVVHANVTDTADGSYTARYILSITAGDSYSLSVRIGGAHLAGSPFTVPALVVPNLSP